MVSVMWYCVSRRSMATRSYRSSEKFHVDDGAEVLYGNAKHVAKEQLIPRIAERNKIAVDTIPTFVYFFPAIRAGRRCSCFDIEESPDSLCRACFGTGIVGGFTKYGTELNVFDVTHPNIRSTNVVPDYSRRTKPIRFTLIDGAKSGTIETRIHLKTNIGIVDSLTSSFFIPPGSELQAWIKGVHDTEYVLLTKDNLAARLYNPWIELRVTFKRDYVKTDSPKLDVIHIRYQNIEDPVIKTNIPRSEKSIMMQEIGSIEDWQTVNFWTDASKIKSVTTSDFFMSASGRTRWKMLTVKEFAPYGHNVSWDIETRLIHLYEPYSKVPAGIVVNRT